MVIINEPDRFGLYYFINWIGLKYSIYFGYILILLNDQFRIYQFLPFLPKSNIFTRDVRCPDVNLGFAFADSGVTRGKSSESALSLQLSHPRTPLGGMSWLVHCWSLLEEPKILPLFASILGPFLRLRCRKQYPLQNLAPQWFHRIKFWYSRKTRSNADFCN